ncbi:MAG: prefoldin subunit beta [Candidatus Altiarchaeales archaeon]|nr:prefoldin subunit beta [Candidatus Altiarchaeota archaeon]MCG2782864.1 prefoldin subunit beta [Candidatus Altiarchaeales archaeon]MBU4266363.1 prefoldin subunit beta [Candidatus Altiarchaeota archaeon]MBU4341174.1 prefoldin subunit beta [Candidatus Altiarchaeota archaeon]MBU4406095.1 prefoldin subunit beta [Candidatus Altiarchaeota archaeon]
MSPEIPTQVQDKVMQFQSLQQQLQMIVSQKQQFIMRARDIDNALEDLGEMKEGKVYKVSGPLMMETDMEKSKKDLAEEKETAEARIKILEIQEKKLTEKLKSLGEELQSIMNSQGTGVVAGG